MLSFWDAYRSTIEFAMVYALFSLSTFAALSGGVLSLASASFAAVGGFGGAIVARQFGLPIELVLVLGGILGASTALLIGFPLLRLSSHWIALATISVVLISRVVVLNVPGTGGAFGLPVTRTVTTWHLVIVLILVMWVFARLRRSRLGLATEAVRADPQVAETLGISAEHVRRVAFVLSGAVSGVAGVLFANLVQFISPNTFYLELAFIMLASVVLGGAYHWLGAVVGGIVFTVLPEVLRSVHVIEHGENIVNGLILILIMIYLPKGLIEPGRRQRRQVAREVERLASVASEQGA